MILVEPVGAEGVCVTCPQCSGTLYTYLPKGRVDSGPTQALFVDGDAVPLFADLTPQERDGFGWGTELNASECPHCATSMVRIVAQFMDVEPSSHVESRFFFRDADRGEGLHFIGRRGADRWIVTRFDTPQGPLLEHEFGPFAAAGGTWIGADGAASGLREHPLDMARDFLLERWDELRLMPKGIGLDRADPKARSHAALVPAAVARAAAWAADRTAGRSPSRRPAATDPSFRMRSSLLRSMTDVVYDAGVQAKAWWSKRRCTATSAMVRFGFGEDCVPYDQAEWQYSGGEIIRHLKTDVIFEVVYDDDQMILRLYDFLVRPVEFGPAHAVMNSQDMPRLGREAIMVIYSWFNLQRAELGQEARYEVFSRT